MNRSFPANTRSLWSAEPDASPRDSPSGAGDGRGYTLLYVEDDAITRNLFRSIVARRYPGLTLFAVADGSAGLKVFKDERPDLVLADLSLPILSGIEMARAIKALDAEAVIIALTAHNNPNYLQSAIEIGFRHYLSKPVRSEKLFATIDKSLAEVSLKRRVSEQELQLVKRQQQLAMAQQITHLGSWEWDVVRGQTSWSDELYRIFGLDPDSVPASYKGFLARVHPADRAGVKKLVQEALKQRRSIISHHCRIVRPDHSIRIVHGQGDVLLDGAGKIVSVVGTAHDVTERRKLEEIIRHQAHHDPLTDLPNRQLFMDFLARDLLQARRDGKKLALLFLDLNDFKQVNDRLGHHCGDRLLKEVAQRLKACIRESDTVARLGGDEFTILMPRLIHADDVGIVLSKILGVFEPPFQLDEVAVNSATSIGVAMFPEDGASSEELMKKADIAMYHAKRTGRNAYQFYNAEINARTAKRQQFEGLLRQAVERRELELLFQPLVCSETRAIVGAEALLRWRHPEAGLQTPDQFLTIAEESGAIVAIGEWVIRQACAQARRWHEQGYPLSVSVNLSHRQFQQEDLVAKTGRIIAETGLLPRQLGFEVTEQTIMADTDFTLRSMQALTDLGVTLAIDNFGRGISSLQWIKKIHPHRVKIDQSFIQNFSTEPGDLAVVNAVVTLSHNLRMEVVASGVETEAQLSLMRQSGCDQLQGNLISAPLDADGFERLVANAC